MVAARRLFVYLISAAGLWLVTAGAIGLLRVVADAFGLLPAWESGAGSLREELSRSLALTVVGGGAWVIVNGVLGSPTWAVQTTWPSLASSATRRASMVPT